MLIHIHQVMQDPHLTYYYGKTKHRSGSEDVCRSYMYMPESKSVVQVVRRNSSLELPVGHDLFHLTFKSE